MWSNNYVTIFAVCCHLALGKLKPDEACNWNYRNIDWENGKHNWMWMKGIISRHLVSFQEWTPQKFKRSALTTWQKVQQLVPSNNLNDRLDLVAFSRTLNKSVSSKSCSARTLQLLFQACHETSLVQVWYMIMTYTINKHPKHKNLCQLRCPSAQS